MTSPRLSVRRHTVFRSQLVPIYARRAARAGIGVGDLLERHGFPANSHDASDVPTTLEGLRGFGDDLARRADDDLFGAHEAMAMPRGTYGVLEYVVRSASCLGAAIGRLSSYSRLVNPALEVRHDTATGIVSERMVGDPEGMGKQSNEFSLVHQMRVARDAAQREFVPRRVFFAHGPGGPDDELKRFFGVRSIEYSAGFTGVELAAADFSTPFVTGDPALLGVLEARARELAGELPAVDELQPIRQAIAEQLRGGEPHAARVARMLGMSERTLSRTLAAQGVTFRAIVDELRYALAIKHLRDDERALSSIAESLGYTDARAFARAFLRWTGVTPAAWRARHRDA